MIKKLIAGCILIAFPLLVWAGGSHSEDHHDHGAEAVSQQTMDHRENEHGRMHAGGDHHDEGHGDMGHKSAVGSPEVASRAERTVRVDLLDSMRFAFDAPLDLRRGEVVRFEVTNRGSIRHEFSIGNEAEQKAHRAMMRQMPDMVHEDPNTVTVEPGDTKVLTWRFEGDDPVVFACNIPGHSEAGMVAKVLLRP